MSFSLKHNASLASALPASQVSSPTHTATSSSHNRVSSLAGLKQIVNPSPLKRKPSCPTTTTTNTQNGALNSTVNLNGYSNTSSVAATSAQTQHQQHSQSFGGVNINNFSQGQIYVPSQHSSAVATPSSASQQLVNPHLAHHHHMQQRSLSNSKQHQHSHKYSNSSSSIISQGKHTMSSSNLKSIDASMFNSLASPASNQNNNNTIPLASHLSMQPDRAQRDSPLKLLPSPSPTDLHPLLYFKQHPTASQSSAQQSSHQHATHSQQQMYASSKLTSNTSTPPLTGIYNSSQQFGIYSSNSSSSNSGNNTNNNKTSQNKKRAKIAATATANTTAASSPTSHQSAQVMLPLNGFNSHQYSGLDKQAHQQSIERIRDNINKKLILQQQQHQSLQENQFHSSQMISNKPNSSSSEHKSAGGNIIGSSISPNGIGSTQLNTAGAAPTTTTSINGIQIASTMNKNANQISFSMLNPMQSIRRKQMNASTANTSSANLINNNANNISGNYLNSRASNSITPTNHNQNNISNNNNSSNSNYYDSNINRFISQTIQQNSNHFRNVVAGTSATTALSHTSTHGVHSLSSPSNAQNFEATQQFNSNLNPNSQNNISNNNNNTINNAMNLNGEFSSLSRGGQCDSREKQATSSNKNLKKTTTNTQQSHPQSASSKNLQYIVQSKLSLNQTPCSSSSGSCNLPTNMPSSGSKSSKALLSKTMSFSTHTAAQFYSPSNSNNNNHNNTTQNHNPNSNFYSKQHLNSTQLNTPSNSQNNHHSFFSAASHLTKQQQQQQNNSNSTTSTTKNQFQLNHQDNSQLNPHEESSASKSSNNSDQNTNGLHNYNLNDPPKVFIKNATISFSGVQLSSNNAKENSQSGNISSNVNSGSGAGISSSSNISNNCEGTQTQSYLSGNPLHSLSNNNVVLDSKEGAGSSAAWVQQQRGNCKVIMSKLDAFDVRTSANPYDHVSEIMSLIHLCLVETPLEKVLEKFDANLQAIAAETRRRSKEILQKSAEKQRTIEHLNEVITQQQQSIQQQQQQLQSQQHQLQQQHQQQRMSIPTTFAQASVAGQQGMSVARGNISDIATQTTPKRKRNRGDQQQNEANSIIQICDQNGNVQEVDTDKENEMLRDYILDQEKKVTVFKEKESNMIKLLLAVKKQGVNIDEIYNTHVLNKQNAAGDLSYNDDNDFVLPARLDQIQGNAAAKNGQAREKVDSKYFRQLEKEHAYADNSIVNDSDESSFGFYGKPSDVGEEEESFVVLGSNRISSKARAAALKKATSGAAAASTTTDDRFKNKNVGSGSNGRAANALAVAAAKKSFKLDLDILKKNQQTEQEDQENLEFHRYIMTTLQITQRTLDALQDQIQNDANLLSPAQLDLIARIHAAQQEYDSTKGILVVDDENQHKKDEDLFDIEVSRLDGNILPSDLKTEFTGYD